MLQGMVVPFAGGERCMRLGMARSSFVEVTFVPRIGDFGGVTLSLLGGYGNIIIWES